jgi:oligoribonuclease NrnB/cAMP/cGMP phosphodiesterase (DHH superfamily)
MHQFSYIYNNIKETTNCYTLRASLDHHQWENSWLCKRLQYICVLHVELLEILRCYI